MKKKLTLLLAILLGVSFAACSVDSSSSNTSDSSTAPSASESSSSSSYEPQDSYPFIGTKTVTVPYTANAPTIDGNLDEVYANAPTIDITEKYYYYNGGPLSTSASAKLLYDDEYIYLYVEVMDYVVDVNNDTVWKRDALGVMLDFNYYRFKDTYSNAQQLKDNIGYVNLAVGGYNPIEYYNLYASNLTLQGKISYAQVISDDGYAYELRLPLPEYSGDIAGEKIGFEPLCLDAYNGDRQGALSWNVNGSEIWQYTHVAGTIIFGDKNI